MISLFICCICRPEVREIDIFKVLKGEFREAEVGVNDSSGAGGSVGDDDRVRTDVVRVFRTSPSLHSILQQALTEPPSVLTGGEGSEKCCSEAEVREDGAAVVRVPAPALKHQNSSLQSAS